MKRTFAILALACGFLCAGSVLAADGAPADKPVPEGFKSLFDGKTLDGWTGNPELWSVQDGCITGTTTAEKPLTYNQFLTWKGEVADFELLIDFRLYNHNSGIQFRAFPNPGREWSLGGYQADCAGLPHMGIIYGENFRGILANVGESVLWKDGKKTVVEKFGEAKDIQSNVDFEGWNTYRVVAQGNHIVQYINGVKTAEMVDEDGVARASGLLGFQLHVGGPMKVQFKNIFLK